jgi:hypothetical protein
MLKSPQGLLSLVGLPAFTKDMCHGNLMKEVIYVLYAHSVYDITRVPEKTNMRHLKTHFF